MSEDNDRSLADDHIFFLRNIFMSKESRIMILNSLLENFKSKNKNSNLIFEFEVKEKDEYYYEEVLKKEREKMNIVSKHLNNETSKRETLHCDLKVIF